MKKRSIVLKIIACLLLCLYSCKKDQHKGIVYTETKIKRNDSVFTLSPPLQKGEVNIDNITKKEKIVILETNSESLIGEIDEIQFDNDFIFISDRHKTKSLFIFTASGSFITKIDALGEGPEEYVSFDGFDIDKNKNIIYILDGSRGNILKWNYNGGYLGKINLPFKNIDTFIYDKNDSFYFNFGFRQDDFNKSKPNNLILYNTKLNQITASFFPYDFESFKLRILDNSLFSKNKDIIYYRTLLGNQVYQLENDSLNLIMECELMESQIPSHCYFLTNKEFKNLLKEKGYAKLGRFIQFDSWMYVCINKGQMSAHYFYDKNNKKGYLDLSYLMNKNKYISPEIFQYSDSVFCGWIPPDHIRLFDKNAEPTSISDEGNPILIFYQLN